VYCPAPWQPLIKKERFDEYAKTVQALDQACLKELDAIIENNQDNVASILQDLTVDLEQVYQMPAMEAAEWLKRVWLMCNPTTRTSSPISLTEQQDILKATFSTETALSLTAPPQVTPQEGDVWLDNIASCVHKDLTAVIAVKNLVQKSSVHQLVSLDP
jgi:hypothetical protein